MKHAIQKGHQLKQKQGLIQHEETPSIRLNKFISESGYASRRAADRLVEKGLVFINGKRAEVGSQVYQGDEVVVEKTTISTHQDRVYIALNKPEGITSTTDLKDATNIVNFMNHEANIFPIGRLDKDSYGLILMTNDGNIVNKILREEFGHDKEYLVTVNKAFTNAFIEQMAEGVSIYNPSTHMMQTTYPCVVESLGPKTFRIVLKQGLNRQIRRMTKALGFKVVSLKRIRIMNIQLGNLKPGEWRYLSEDELQTLNHTLVEASLRADEMARDTTLTES